MGVVTSSLDEKGALYLRDPNRFVIEKIEFWTGSDNDKHLLEEAHRTTQNLITVTRLDASSVEFVQVKTDTPRGVAEEILLKIPKSQDDLNLVFTFVLHRSQLEISKNIDTNVNGLTLVHASSFKELDYLLTTEYSVEANLQNHKNVFLVGNLSTEGKDSNTIKYQWKWSKPAELNNDNRGWRSCCRLAEYNERTNSFVVLASFSFFVALEETNKINHSSNDSPLVDQVNSIPFVSLKVSPIDTNVGQTGQMPGHLASNDDLSPLIKSNMILTQSDVFYAPNEHPKYEYEDDGPLFRATIQSLEQKTRPLKERTKDILKKTIALRNAHAQLSKCQMELRDTLEAASRTSYPTMSKFMDVYLREILNYALATNDQVAGALDYEIIDPLRRIYDNDIKAAEQRRVDFNKQSDEFYTSTTRYLSKKTESERTDAKKDAKFQNKKKAFELKKLEYYEFLNDLHEGRRQHDMMRFMLTLANVRASLIENEHRVVTSLQLDLDNLFKESEDALKHSKLIRLEREQKRRAIETIGLDNSPLSPAPNATSYVGGLQGEKNGTTISHIMNKESPKDDVGDHKEGILWAFAKPISHPDPKVLAKITWHKYWVVLSHGTLNEYTNWKTSPRAHMDAIDLRLAAVKDSNSLDRRFCFEVVTPQFTRIYQATSAEDQASWKIAIQNAITKIHANSNIYPTIVRQKSRELPDYGAVFRKKGMSRTNSGKMQSTTLDSLALLSDNSNSQYVLERIKLVDSENNICADCGSSEGVEWVSINLSVLVCIDCCGHHRSLGSHVSKMRSLTLDIYAFTDEMISLLSIIGNKNANKVWEEKLDLTKKPTVSSSSEEKSTFIISKYRDKHFIRHISLNDSTSLLWRALQAFDVRKLYNALVLGANINYPLQNGIFPLQWIFIAADSSFQPNELSIPLTCAELLIQWGAPLEQLDNEFLSNYGISGDMIKYIRKKNVKRHSRDISFSPNKSSAFNGRGSVNRNPRSP